MTKRTAPPISISISVGLALMLGLAAGCQDEPKAKPSANAAPKVKLRETVGKTTQDVLKLTEAIAQGGVLAETTIPVADPLTQNAAAYRTTVAKLGGMAVDQAIQIRNAQNIADPKPLSHDEFMAEIIKKGQPDGIRLPTLPYYQEYAWDEAKQKLVVVDFPRQESPNAGPAGQGTGAEVRSRSRSRRAGAVTPPRRSARG